MNGRQFRMFTIIWNNLPKTIIALFRYRVGWKNWVKVEQNGELSIFSAWMDGYCLQVTWVHLNWRLNLFDFVSVGHELRSHQRHSSISKDNHWTYPENIAHFHFSMFGRVVFIFTFCRTIACFKFIITLSIKLHCAVVFWVTILNASLRPWNE